MSERHKKNRLRQTLRRFLFSPNGVCPVCGKILFRTSSFLCERCDHDLPRVIVNTCRYCGKPLFDTTLDFCRDCGPRNHKILDGGLVWLYYEGSGKKLVHSLKFGHLPQLGIWIGQQMAEVLLEKTWADSLDAVIAVPLHEKRLEERGYNQSDYLAQGMAETLKLPLLTNLIKRLYNTPHQIGLSREERLVNLTGAFSVTEKDAVKGKSLLLIDDVNTTGATLQECADTLKRAGAAAVYTAACAGAL